MTIDSVTLSWSRSGGSDSVDENNRRTINFQSGYQVVHSADATEIEILSATGLPQTGDLFPGTSYVTCRSRSLQRDGLILSTVTCNYTGEAGPNGPDDSPLNKPPEISYYSVASDEEIDFDAFGLPITNTAGDPVKGVTKTINDMELAIKRNFLAVNGQLALRYLDSVNSDTFTILGDSWAPGTAAMQQFSIRPVYERNIVAYFEVDCRISLRVPYMTTPARAWWKRYVSEGLYEFGRTLNFSGGGGSGAAGVAYSRAGAIVGAQVTNPGSGYTSAPSVSVTETGGSGATFTATVDAAKGIVTGVSVSAGGSGYKNDRVRIVDRNKEPITTPVLLDANGKQITSGSSAFFIERPVKQYILPYNALGLI